MPAITSGAALAIAKLVAEEGSTDSNHAIVINVYLFVTARKSPHWYLHVLGCDQQPMLRDQWWPVPQLSTSQDQTRTPLLRMCYQCGQVSHDPVPAEPSAYGTPADRSCYDHPGDDRPLLAVRRAAPFCTTEYCKVALSLSGKRRRPRSSARLLTAPAAQRLGRAADLPRDRSDRRPIRAVVNPVLLHYPHRTLANLRRKLGTCRHHSPFSQIGASGKAGTLHWLGWRSAWMDRQELSDSIWARMKPHLPGKATDPGRTGRDNRLFVEAI